MTPRLSKIVPRRLREVALRRASMEPVLLLHGPRAVGKSTLLRTLADPLGGELLDLDDLSLRGAVRADPALFVSAPHPVLIDEYQHVPDLLAAIKAELNRDTRPGRFILTGSTRYTTLPEAGQALTGRMHRMDVRPLSQGETGEVHEDFAELLLGDPRLLVAGVATATRGDYVKRVVAGGFPMVLQRTSEADRIRWYDDYLELVLERDVLDLARVRQRRQLPRLLRQLAAQTGQVLNIAKAAQAIEMDKSTAENYAKLLEAVFLVHPLPAWGRTLGGRAAASPKIHVVDSGLAARLLRLTAPKLSAASASALSEFGHLLETFVVGEVCKQLDWVEEPSIRGHWRTHDGDEVDLVVERGDGRVAALEVKAGSRVTSEDLRGVLAIRRRLGSDFLGGVVLYTGARAYSLHEGIHIVPVARLWSPPNVGATAPERP